MSAKKENDSIRTMVFLIVLIPIIAYLLYFAYQKSTQSVAKARDCEEQCIEQGYPGYEFKWSVLSGPQCGCFGAIEKVEK